LAEAGAASKSVASVCTAAAVVCTPPASVLVAPVRFRELRSGSAKEKEAGSFQGQPAACEDGRWAPQHAQRGGHPMQSCTSAGPCLWFAG
jgi:hypothetical protein